VRGRRRERGHGKRAEQTHTKPVRSGAERELPGTSDEKTLETELTSSGGERQNTAKVKDSL